MSLAKYQYAELSQPDTIRLLNIFPQKDDPETLRCKLLELPLRISETLTRPYEALSYVWGSEDSPRSIIITDGTDDRQLKVTNNLHSALLHLRDNDISRIIWVDAVCINQSNNAEKKGQIGLMPAIYSKASRVIVWLGDSKDDGSSALETIRDAAEGPRNFSSTQQPSETSLIQHSENASETELPTPRAVLALLRRPWFRRIWVLQEVAAAQHVLIKCGPVEIDGHTFCLGLEHFKHSVNQIAFLIRRAGRISSDRGRTSLNICPLSELVDMYHTHEATEPLDMVYALLGMCSDIKDLSRAGIEPNYMVEWRLLIDRFVQALFQQQASIIGWNKREMPVIEAKGFILGTVLEIGSKSNTYTGETQNLKVKIYQPTDRIADTEPKELWTLRGSATPIRAGDIICFLHGATRPTIIRAYGTFFRIITVAPNSPQPINSGMPLHFTRNLLLLWDWKISLENSQTHDECDVLIEMAGGQLKYETARDGPMETAVRLWNVAQILGDVARILKNRRAIEEVERARQTAALLFQQIVAEGHFHSQKCQCGRIPLLWAAEIGYKEVTNLILTQRGVDPNLRDYAGRTPLLWAAMGGHEAIVRLLLKSDVSVEADSTEYYGRTPLSYAAEGGHNAVTKLLLDSGLVKADSADYSGRTPLSYAAEGGHNAVTKLLLDSDLVKADSEAHDGRTPLSYAMGCGHEVIVGLLLGSDLVKADSTDHSGRTPLSYAAEGGHNAVTKLLLDSDLVKADLKDYSGRTPLSYAAEGGHIGVTRLLLDSDFVKVDSKDLNGRTSLSYAAEGGHNAVTRLLLDSELVNVDSKDYSGRVPLSYASEGGHESVVRLLLDSNLVEVDYKDYEGRTPLSFASEGGHETIMRLLQHFNAV